MTKERRKKKKEMGSENDFTYAIQISRNSKLRTNTAVEIETSYSWKICDYDVTTT